MLSGDLNNRNIYYKVAILNHKPLDSTVPVLFSSNDFNPFRYGGGRLLGPPCQKIAISPEPNLRWTSKKSVNSSLSVVVQ